MKTSILILMALISDNAMAINKCISNGKITYQASPCNDESQKVDITLRKITDQEKIKSTESKKNLDSKIASDKKNKEDTLKAYREARTTGALISGHSTSLNEAAMQVINDDTAKELAKSAIILHRMSGR